jgi:aspartyl-tRNA(Asn)/glutamyl-tRNA(Gln) amidotransferase subunit A
VVAVSLSVIAGHDPRDYTSAPGAARDYAAEMSQKSTRRYRIGIPKEYSGAQLSPAVAKALDSLKSDLQKAGHSLVDVDLPHTAYAVSVYYIVAVSEASSNLARFDGVRFGQRLAQDRPLVEMYQKTRSLFGQEVKRRILLGTFALSAGYYDAYYRKACQVRTLIRRDFEGAFGKADVILSPVSPSTAYRLGEKSADPLRMYLDDIFTIPVNLAGLPSVAVPVGRDSGGLPIGAQFIGPHFSESRLLGLSQWVEDNVYREVLPNVL